MNKMTRQEFLESKKKTKRLRGGGVFIALNKEEHKELESKAEQLDVTMVTYAKSRIFYDDLAL